MYHSHPLDSAYGNPGFFVDSPSGSVRDSSGRSVSLKPEFDERHARRVLIRSSELSSTDGVYSARIRKAKNVSAIKLSYASIPKAVSRVTAQLILYSVNIKQNLSAVKAKERALQRLCRSQLLSKDTSDFPFFQITQDQFDWRALDATTTWVNSSDRSTRIPPQLESEISNQYMDMDILTVLVPSMCNLQSLGSAFSNVLKSHSGARHVKNNSLWSHFDISVEEAGFSVLENINDSESFSTFASIYSADMQPLSGIQTQSAQHTLRPMGTPLTIKLTKSRSVFLTKDSLDGASTAPADVSTSSSIMTEFIPTASNAGDDTFTVSIPTASNAGDDTSTVSVTLTTPTVSVGSDNRIVHSFSCLNDVSADDVLEVTFKKVIEVSIELVPETGTNPVFTVRYRYGTFDDLNSVVPSGAYTIHSQDRRLTTTINEKTENSIGVQGDWDKATSELTTSDNKKIIITTGTSLFIRLNNETEVVSVSEVKRSYQKHRDVRLGLRWGENKENEDFFIDQNNSFDCPLVNVGGKVTRKDVAELSQDDVDSVVDFNGIRNTGDLEDTYLQPTEGMHEIYNIHEFNDAHQIERMLFAGPMMNVEEPEAMPLNSDAHIDPNTAPHRPPSEHVIQGGTTTRPINEFYDKGLGWQTAIIDHASRFVMPAFPVRFTQIDNPSDANTPESIYKVGAESVPTSVSPLVSKILSVTRVGEQQLGYYALNKLDAQGQVDASFSEQSGSSATDQHVGNVSYYAPRPDNHCGIVVNIGEKNYVVKSARLVSVLRNKTAYTLNLNCDRNKESSSTPLSSVVNLQKVVNDLRKTPEEKRSSSKKLQLTQMETALENSFHAFYVKTIGGYEPDANAKYFSWVFELDRPVQLSTSIVGDAYAGPGSPNPYVADRVFNGVVDSSSMFVPGVFERETGRPALTNVQQAAHSFFVRSGTQESENPLLVLHNIGTMERPINSVSNLFAGNVFAVMGSDSDQKKVDKMACETTTFFRSPENLDRIDFSFISSKTGKHIDIGKQNATLILDLYSSNE